MKFTCLQENLVKGLQTVTKTISAKSPLPVLANVLIETKDGRVKLTATNLETYITTYIPASIDKEGSTTAPAKTLKDFVSNLNPGTITIEVHDDILHVSSEKSKSKINGVPSSEYPELPVLNMADNHNKVDQKELAGAISLVAFAAGADESRPVFTGVYLNILDKTMTIASTDGYRLSEKILETPEALVNMSVIIPAKTLMEISRLFSSATEPIKMSMSENNNLIMFSFEDTFIATRILDGQYPDYKRIIPKEVALKAHFNATEFLEAVRLTSVFSKESTDPIKLKIDPEKGIRISSIATETGEHESSINAEVQGDPLEIALKAKYITDFLSNIKATNITMHVNGSSSPCLIKSAEHDNFLHIVVPTQI